MRKGKDVFGDRMKEYEKAYNIILPKRLPVIVRIDGKAFHSLLRGAKRPFDEDFKLAMDEVGRKLVKEVQGAVFAYLQSDEINLLIITYSSIDYSPYFNNELQKIVSITSSLATREFNKHYEKKGCFDSRAFILPKEEVCNYFLWRQRDWEKNSIQMVARMFYSHKELQSKKCADMHEMLFDKETNWNDLPSWQKRGRCIYKKTELQEPDVIRTKCIIDNEIPIFSKDRDYINKYVFLEEGQ